MSYLYDSAWDTRAVVLPADRGRDRVEEEEDEAIMEAQAMREAREYKEEEKP